MMDSLMGDMGGRMTTRKSAAMRSRTETSESVRAEEHGSLREVALSDLHTTSLPRKHVPAGAMLMHPDEETESLYFILEGRIRLYRLAPNGEEVFQGELGPGDSLKCPRLLCKHDCHSFAQAVVDTMLEVLPKPLFERLVRESMPFNRMLMREVASQMIDLDRRLYETAVMPMKVRLHAELLRIAQRRGDGTLAVVPPPTHQELAQRIGAQREAVSKELAQLSRAGIVRCSRAVIIIQRERTLREEMADWSDGTV